jgi:putative phosphoesterase
VIVGVISDTHGLLRPEALHVLRGADRILHAGDIGGPEILLALQALAPVTAVRGNNDRGAWAEALPEVAHLDVGGLRLVMVHDLGSLEPARAAGASAVIAGHSHKPHQDRRDGVLYFNPGSAGPRRFRLPISVGRLVIEGGRIEGELHTLLPAPAARSRR